MGFALDAPEISLKKHTAGALIRRCGGLWCSLGPGENNSDVQGQRLTVYHKLQTLSWTPAFYQYNACESIGNYERKMAVICELFKMRSW